MTISYTSEVPTVHGFGNFWKLLFRWRGSIYKVVYRELLVFTALYYACSGVYRFLLNEGQKETFERVAQYCESFSDLIPVSFVLGFYVSLVIKRWWDQYMEIPWPDSLAMFVSTCIHGNDDRGRLMRRTIMRYVNLSLNLTLRMMCTSVKKRFPTMDHFVEAGILLPNEKKIIEDLDNKTNHCKYWMPLVWAGSVVTRARKELRIKDDFAVKTLIDELASFRRQCGTILNYDWVPIPLVYTQVVTLAVYTFFMACIMGRQYLENSKHKIDLIVPIFTMLQFFFYMGWMKVAETLINPFGEDDEDFEMNWMVDRNIQISYLIVDEMHQEHPELVKDQYWDEVFPTELPYTAAAEPFRCEPPQGSTADIEVPEDMQEFVPMEAIHEENFSPQFHIGDGSSPVNDKSYPVYIMNRGMMRNLSRTSIRSSQSHIGSYGKGVSRKNSMLSVFHRYLKRDRENEGSSFSLRNAGNKKLNRSESKMSNSSQPTPVQSPTMSRDPTIPDDIFKMSDISLSGGGDRNIPASSNFWHKAHPRRKKSRGSELKQKKEVDVLDVNSKDNISNTSDASVKTSIFQGSQEDKLDQNPHEVSDNVIPADPTSKTIVRNSLSITQSQPVTPSTSRSPRSCDVLKSAPDTPIRISDPGPFTKTELLQRISSQSNRNSGSRAGLPSCDRKGSLDEDEPISSLPKSVTQPMPVPISLKYENELKRKLAANPLPSFITSSFPPAHFYTDNDHIEYPDRVKLEPGGGDYAITARTPHYFSTTSHPDVSSKEKFLKAKFPDSLVPHVMLDFGDNASPGNSKVSSSSSLSTIVGGEANSLDPPPSFSPSVSPRETGLAALKYSDCSVPVASMSICETDMTDSFMGHSLHSKDFSPGDSNLNVLIHEIDAEHHQYPGNIPSHHGILLEPIEENSEPIMDEGSSDEDRLDSKSSELETEKDYSSPLKRKRSDKFLLLKKPIASSYQREATNREKPIVDYSNREKPNFDRYNRDKPIVDRYNRDKPIVDRSNRDRDIVNHTNRSQGDETDNTNKGMSFEEEEPLLFEMNSDEESETDKSVT